MGVVASMSTCAATMCKVGAKVMSGKGTVTGAGSYRMGATVTLKAKPASGYRFLRWESCCSDLDAVSSTLRERVEESTTYYAYFKKKSVVPKPSVASGKYTDRIRVSWKASSGAVSYKIRRGRTTTYSKSRVIAEVEGTAYNDYTCWEDGKYYYWILPVDSTGKAFASKSKYAGGRAKIFVEVYGASTLAKGESYQYSMGTACTPGRYGKWKWRIVSGSAYATLSSTGVLRGKKAGRVVIQGTYKGKTVKKAVRITNECDYCGPVPNGSLLG